MRNGYKVYDVDTHVMPIAEVLERYVDPSFRPRLVELAPYRVPAGPMADARGATNIVSIDASTAASSARRICTHVHGSRGRLARQQGSPSRGTG